ncbi:PIG-L deacetylase family protein [Bythopirellula goksoeyrii]|uniref:4-oxalmesaconate hydratase n=1 Tax=Bythopirellula goksoeyrii TaxID=1400387 RepID=A0A5B9Q6A3_9BACT|nr:PIG-L family deacetylase [Bythopirellula goksoeyrii]QEG34558.1 4-oxalmesaconate hydratase [Bythopirellula goksoeyrii]
MTSKSSPRRVALAFLAHPDDAEMFCAGTLLRLAELGWEIHIATATPGDCGSATMSRDEIAEIRRAEGAAAAKVLGGTYHCVEERDLNVVFDKPTNRKVIDLFRQIAPSLVFTHPLFDYMLDHEQVHQLARSAAFGYSAPNGSSLPLVAGSMIPWLYYCDPIEGCDPYTREVASHTVCVDITEVIERKSEMLASHASQREWLRAHHGMDEYIETMKRLGAMRGQEIGSSYAEAFTQHRGHPYPQSDLLRELLGEK